MTTTSPSSKWICLSTASMIAAALFIVLTANSCKSRGSSSRVAGDSPTGKAQLLTAQSLKNLKNINSPVAIGISGADQTGLLLGSSSDPKKQKSCGYRKQFQSMMACLDTQGQCLRNSSLMRLMILGCDYSCGDCSAPPTFDASKLSPLSPAELNREFVYGAIIAGQKSFSTLGSMLATMLNDGYVCALGGEQRVSSCKKTLMNGGIIVVSFAYPPAGVVMATGFISFYGTECVLTTFSPDNARELATTVNQYVPIAGEPDPCAKLGAISIGVLASEGAGYAMNRIAARQASKATNSPKEPVVPPSSEPVTAAEAAIAAETVTPTTAIGFYQSGPHCEYIQWLLNGKSWALSEMPKYLLDLNVISESFMTRVIKVLKDSAKPAEKDLTLFRIAKWPEEGFVAKGFTSTTRSSDVNVGYALEGTKAAILITKGTKIIETQIEGLEGTAIMQEVILPPGAKFAPTGTKTPDGLAIWKVGF